MKKNCRNRKLVFSNCQLGLESANVIAHILQNNNKFCRLHLDKNCLEDQGVELIAESLKYNENIIHVDITSNNIGPEGFSALFEALLENESIISIDISSREGLNRNRLGDKGAQNLETYLRYSETIVILKLSAVSLSCE